jgi:hypothetical protein
MKKELFLQQNLNACAEMQKHESKQRRADARLVAEYLEIIADVLPSNIDTNNLVYSKYGYVSVKSITTMLQKQKNNLYSFVANSQRHIDKDLDKVVIIVIKATFKGVVIIERDNLPQDRNISLEVIKDLLQNGLARHSKKLEAKLLG